MIHGATIHYWKIAAASLTLTATIDHSTHQLLSTHPLLPYAYQTPSQFRKDLVSPKQTPSVVTSICSKDWSAYLNQCFLLSFLSASFSSLAIVDHSDHGKNAIAHVVRPREAAQQFIWAQQPQRCCASWTCPRARCVAKNRFMDFARSGYVLFPFLLGEFKMLLYLFEVLGLTVPPWLGSK